MAVAVGAFREAAEQETALEAVAERLDRALRREKEGRHGTDAQEDFTTAVIVEIPVESPGVLRLVNRGHPAPLLLSDGRTEFLDPAEPALPLGVSEIGHWPDHAEEFPFPRGTQILFYTDGVSEARDEAGSFYPLGTRLSGRDFSDPEELLDAVLADIGTYVGGRAADDLALVAVQRGADVA